MGIDTGQRDLRLTPEVVLHWTRLIESARPHLTAGSRPCDYSPWTVALLKAQDLPVPERQLTDRYAHWDHHTRLRGIVEDVARPAWTDPRRDLIDFALLFIEADVMQFRSGYMKRHLARRLRQAQLPEAGLARIGAVVRRGTTPKAGTGDART